MTGSRVRQFEPSDIAISRMKISHVFPIRKNLTVSLYNESYLTFSLLNYKSRRKNSLSLSLTPKTFVPNPSAARSGFVFQHPHVYFQIDKYLFTQICSPTRARRCSIEAPRIDFYLIPFPKVKTKERNFRSIVKIMRNTRAHEANALLFPCTKKTSTFQTFLFTALVFAFQFLHEFQNELRIGAFLRF